LKKLPLLQEIPPCPSKKAVFWVALVYFPLRIIAIMTLIFLATALVSYLLEPADHFFLHLSLLSNSSTAAPAYALLWGMLLGIFYPILTSVKKYKGFLMIMGWVSVILAVFAFFSTASWSIFWGDFAQRLSLAMAFLTLAAMFFYIWAKDKDKQRNTWKSFFLRFLGVPLLLFLAFVLYDFTGQHYFATGAKSFLLADFGKYVREVQNGTTFDAAWRGRPQITYNLQGVDPPKESPFREEAVQALWSYLSDANTIQYYYDSKFQRGTVIARLKLQDGRDLATALIRMGLAVPEFTFFPRADYQSALAEAQRLKRGMWRE
jgi:endonuclease YncB( thermonuclease family)